MKKRVLSVLLVVALLIAVGVVAAQANETETWQDRKTAGEAVIQAAEELTIDPENPVATCPVCNEEKTWKALSTIVGNYSEKNQRYEQYLYYNTHYYVDQPLTLEHAALQTVSKDPTTGEGPCVFLNGKSITSTNTNLFVGAMNLFGSGTVSVNSTTAQSVLNANGGILNIYGGTYTTSATADLTYSTLFSNNGNAVVSLYGGTIEGVNDDAAWIYGDSSFYMYGGEITGRQIQSYNHGVSYVGIYGGEISAANAYFAQGTLDVQGGKIAKLQVRNTNTDFTISGNPEITLLDLTSGSTKKPTFGVLTSGASIGFGTYTEGVISQPYTDLDLAQDVAESFPTALKLNQAVTVNDAGELVLGKKTYTSAEIATESAKQNGTFGTTEKEAFCYACSEYVTWKPLTEGAAIAGDHYFLANDMTTTTDTTYGMRNTSGKMCLHLNGKNITFSTLHAPMVALHNGGSEMNVFATDSSIQQSANGWATVNNNGNVMNVYGGTYTNIRRDQYNLFETKKGTMNLYNVTGTIAHNATFGNVLASGGTVNIENSTIPNAKATGANGVLNIKSGNIGTVSALAGTVNISGGTIGSFVGGEAAVTITISGAPVINAMDMSASAVPADLTGLKDGAKITVSNEGTISKAFASPEAAEAAKAYFVVPEGYELKVTNNQLVCSEVVINGDADMIAYANNMTFDSEDDIVKFCPHCKDLVTWRPFTNNFVGPYATFPTLMLNYGGINHYFVQETVTDLTAAVLTNHTNVVLHLNGQTISTTGRLAISAYTGAELIVLGNGTVTSSNSATVGGGGTTRIYGGTYSNTYDGDGVCAPISASSATATIEINAGTVNTSKKYGAYLKDGGKVTLNGGTLHGSVFHDGANAETTFTMNGGIIDYTGENNTVGFGSGIANLNGGTITSGTIYSGGTTDEETGAVLVGTTLNLGNVTLGEGVVFNNNPITSTVNVLDTFAGNAVFNIAVADETAAYPGQKVQNVLAPNGLNANATVYGKQQGTTTTYGILYDTTADDGSLVVGKTSIVNGETETWYENNAAAAAAYSTGVLKLYSGDALDLGSKDATVDINGNIVNISTTGAFVGLDSSTKGKFDATPGVAVITGTTNITAPESTHDENKVRSGYIAVDEEVGYTFTYFEMKLSGISLKAKQDEEGNPLPVGLYYRGTWSFNSNLPEGCVSAGMVVKPQERFDENNFMDDNYSGWYSVDAKEITNGKERGSLLVDGILKTDRDPADNEELANTVIYAAAFVCVQNGDNKTIILTDAPVPNGMSLRDVFAGIEGNDVEYEKQKVALTNFYADWADLANIANWDLPKYGKES